MGETTCLSCTMEDSGVFDKPTWKQSLFFAISCDYAVGIEILHGFNFLFLRKSYWQEAEVGIVFAVVGLLRGRWLFWSQYAPSGEWCFKANTQYMHTIAVITIAVINETLKAALQGHLLPSRLIKGLSLTSIKTEEKRGRGRYI